MIILSIETSCDETAVSVVEALGDFPHAKYEVLSNALFSQIEIHREFGGVFPAIAKREHVLALIPLLEKALGEAHLDARPHTFLYPEDKERLHTLLTRELGMAENLISFHERYNNPAIDLIAVTSGPGLEPALWVGINFAKALASLWNIPVVPVNHMEGHVLASIFDGAKLPTLSFPAIALLISGGHTELVLLKDWLTYELIGQTRDDAVGEAFDKVARMLGLPYPGGPEISRLARNAREKKLAPFADLPKPMLGSGDCDFSFSGLKTAVRNVVANKSLTDEEKESLARDFEDTVTEVLLKKTERAIATYGAHSLIIGGGVSANTHIRNTFEHYFSKHYPALSIYFPERTLSTDNAIMIALTGHARIKQAISGAEVDAIAAKGNRPIAQE